MSTIGILTALAGCSQEDSSYAKIEFDQRNRPKAYCEIVERASNTIILCLDVDDDGKIDEALLMTKVPTYLSGLSSPDLIRNRPKEQWRHLFAPEFQGKTFYVTENSAEMSPEMRENLSAGYRATKYLNK